MSWSCREKLIIMADSELFMQREAYWDINVLMKLIMILWNVRGLNDPHKRLGKNLLHFFFFFD